MFGMLRAMSLRDSFMRKLRVIESEHPTAETQKKGECCRSGVCCWRRPCQLAPGDEVPIAAHLGLSVGDLFRQYLVVDEVGRGTVLVPRRRQQTGGRFLSMEETYDIDTPCVFLGEGNACQIHEVKPAGGRHFKCWDKATETADPPGVAWTDEQLMALGWDGNRDTDECDDYDGDDE